MNILVVDDSPTMRRMVKASLGGLSDVAFEEAGTGLKAIECLTLKPIDLIVLDLNMPGMDGLDVVRYVRGHKDLHDIPIIVLSGGDGEGGLETPLAVGASCCLAKPFDPAELKTRASELLKANQSGNQDMSVEMDQSMDFSEFMVEYFAECEKLMSVLRRDVLELEKHVGQATADSGLLNEVLLSLHTLKGMSGAVEVAEAARLAGAMEVYLRALRHGQEHLGAVGIHGLACGIEMLNQVVAARRAELPPPDLTDVLDELDHLVSHPQTALASSVTDAVNCAPRVPNVSVARPESPPSSPNAPVLAPEASLLETARDIRETIGAAGEVETQNGKPITTTSAFLLFNIEEAQYALDVAAVERAVPAAEVTPLPDAPECVLGLINIAGEIMPVVDTRRRLGFPHRDMELSDRFILARAAGKPLVLLVDRVEGVVELSEHEVAGAEAASSGSATAVATMPGSIVLIQDIGKFASAAELWNVGKMQMGAHA
jgi:chemotaxis signal transduction protein/DNA-binding response OmpR family regulator